MGRVHQENGGLAGAQARRGLKGAGLHLDTLRFYLAGDSFNDIGPAGAKLAPTTIGSGVVVSNDSAFVGGKSLYFPGDAAGQLLIYPHNASLDLGGGDWTVACRVKWGGDASHYNAIFAKRQSGTEYEGYLNVNTATIDYFNGANYSSATVPPIGQWVHLAYQFKNGTGLRVYLNGSQIAAFNVTSTASGTNQFVVGGVSGLFEPFQGFIQDFAIWRSLPWGFADFTPPADPILQQERDDGLPLGGIWQLGTSPFVIPRRKPLATGGSVIEVTQDGITYRIHTFTSIGNNTLTVSQGGPIEALIVGGGGGGGAWVGGGGGAGGLIYAPTLEVEAQTYTITVGAGGTGWRAGSNVSTTGTNGGNSSAFGLTALGGGRAGAWTHGAPLNGGSGGGGHNTIIGASAPAQGFAGGQGRGTNPYENGGGGGAGGAGETFTTNKCGNGGPGLYFPQFTHAGSPAGWFAGGGGGGAHDPGPTPGTGGNGGGGNGLVASTAQAGSGVASTGGGGGGNGLNGSSLSWGGNGGSGIVIIRYAI